MPAMPSVHTHKTSASSLPPEESLGCSSNILYAFVSVETVPNVPFVPIKSIMFNIINIYRLCYQSHLFHFARSDADHYYAILSWYRLYQKLYGTFGTFGTLSAAFYSYVANQKNNPFWAYQIPLFVLVYNASLLLQFPNTFYRKKGNNLPFQHCIPSPLHTICYQ